tara:strand:+ start:568 stop:822 length:255 start_codon:yes stop_codon:yes gene_type:complete
VIVDPYEIHPEQEKLKKQKLLLTKENLFVIIDSLIENIQKTETPVWGFKQSDLLRLLKTLSHKVEKDFKDVSSEQYTPNVKQGA